MPSKEKRATKPTAAVSVDSSLSSPSAVAAEQSTDTSEGTNAAILHRSSEAALLFWLNAVTNNASLSASPPPSAAPVLPVSGASTEVVVPSTNFRLGADKTAALTSDTASEAADHVALQGGQQNLMHAALLTENQPQPTEPTEETTVALLSSPSHTFSHLVVHDVMPLFDALLDGQLGPVVLDVQLQGHTRLLQHPQQFEATLQCYERQSAGPLKEALSNVQPFFILCNRPVGSNTIGTANGGKKGNSVHSEEQQMDAAENENDSVTKSAAAMRRHFSSGTSASSPTTPQALYTMDPANHYPVLPLLAQLLHSPKVTKVLLRSRLLYRLLFLFLGTDRVDIQQVVDVTTWSELGRQLRPALTAVYPIPVDGVADLAEVQSTLPVEVQQLLASEAEAIAQQHQQQEQESVSPLPRWQPAVQSGNEGGADALFTGGEGSSESDTATTSCAISREGSNVGGDKRNDEETEGCDSDTLIANLMAAQDAGNEEASGSGNDEVEEEQMDAVALLQRFVPVQQQPLMSTLKSKGSTKRPRQALSSPHIQKNNQKQRHLSSRSPPCDTTVLASVYRALKSIAVFYAEVLTKFFDNVTGGAGPVSPAITASVTNNDSALASVAAHYCLSPSDWCAQRTYAEFLCEIMTYHGVFVHDAVYHSMNTILDVQLQAIEDLAERVVTLFLERVCNSANKLNGNNGKPENCINLALGGETTCMTAEYFRQCLARGPAATLLAVQPRLDASLLRALAKEAAARQQQDAELATQLRLSCQLVCIWIAYHDRTEAKRKITDMFGKVADRVQARVLEQPSDAVASLNNSHQSTSTRCEVCFSVHPTWSLHNSSTGRIFSTLPNVQNLSKQLQRTTFAVHALHAAPPPLPPGGKAPPRPYGAVDIPSIEDIERWVGLVGGNEQTPPVLFPEKPQWTLRHLYRAPPGCVLLSFDYNQLELRVLAQLSGDATLRQHLSSKVDVLTLTTASVLQLPSTDRVQPHQRQAVKVIVYGLLYGMGPKAMEDRIRKIQRSPSDDVQPTGELISTTTNENNDSSGNSGNLARRAVPLTALQLIARFHHVYPRVESYLRETRQTGLHTSSVETLSGRKSLAAVTDANRRKQRAVAQAIQGGAADVVLCGMRAVHQQRHAVLPYLPAAPFALIMTIHDELVYAVPRAAVGQVARAVKGILEGQAEMLRLDVPLPISVRVGSNFGALEDYHFD